MGREVHRVTLGPFTTGTATATTNREVIDKLDRIPLVLFDELIAYFEVTTAPIESLASALVQLYLQRAVRPEPEIGEDADWDDYASPDEWATTEGNDRVLYMPHRASSDTPDIVQGHDRAVNSLAVDTVRDGHWGDRLRLVEDITGQTLSTAMTYNLHLTGVFNR